MIFQHELKNVSLLLYKQNFRLSVVSGEKSKAKHVIDDSGMNAKQLNKK